ncbi:MAG TPA: O-antigen ligase family protein [Acidimicrobiales bacterium]|nr:O-antigen ligase family protein [Acidimicrobiales bacterium]
MTTLLAETESPPPPPRPGIRFTGKLRVLVFIGSALAAALAVISALGVINGGTKAEFVTPIAIGVGILLGLLAITRFKMFVLLLLVLRASVDITRVSGHSAGSTANTGAGKAGNPSTILALVLIVASIVWLLAQYRREGRLPAVKVRQVLILFFVTGLLSILASANPGPSAVEAMRLLAVVMMYVVAEQLSRDALTRRQLVAAAFASSIFPLALTGIGFATGHPRSELKGSYTRIIGTFTQSNDFGIYLMFLIIMGVAVYPHLSVRWRWVMRILLVGWTVCCVLTYTRSALIGVVLGLIVIGVFQSKRILVLMALGAVVCLALVPPLFARFSSLASQNNVQVVNGRVALNQNSLSWRLNYWTQILPLANRSPVIGIGLGETQYSTTQTKQPHNDYVKAYVETGLFGLTAYVLLQLSLLTATNRARKRAVRGTWDYGVAVGALGCCVAFLAVSMVANVIGSVVNVWYLFVFVAAAVGPMLAAPPGSRDEMPRQLTPGQYPGAAATGEPR